MTDSRTQPRLYTDLARWWPLFSPPSCYVEEAEDLLPTLSGVADSPPKTLLELGSGGGSLAFHLKRHFTLTLSDRSEQMLEISRGVNPECEHVLGDMRTLELSREFDLVFVHDAIMYAVEPDDVRATLATAARHCRPGGGVVVVPDFVLETYEPGTEWGGEDAPDGRGLRYLEWDLGLEPGAHACRTAYAFLLRETDGTVYTDSDLHRCGIFPRAAWLEWFAELGLRAESRLDPWNRDVFGARKPRQPGSGA